MRILQFITQLEAAGAQSQALNLQEELKARGHTVETVFFYVKRPAFADIPHSSLYRRPLKVWQAPSLLIKITQKCIEFQPDIVMPFSHWSNVIVAPLAFLTGRSVIANQTQVPSRVPKAARLIDRLWGRLGIYRLNIANSEATIDEMKRGTSAGYAKRLRLVRLGVWHIPVAEDKKALRRAFGLPDAPLLMHLGRLSTQKNHGLLLKVLALLDGVNLVCVGDGELRERLHQEAEALGITDRVHWMGERNRVDVARLFSATDVFVFPSLWEGFGLAPVEAAAAGLPLILSDIQTFRDVMALSDGRFAGELVDPKDPAAWASSIKKVLSNQTLNKDLKERSASLAQRYSISAMADGYEACFSEIRSL